MGFALDVVSTGPNSVAVLHSCPMRRSADLTRLPQRLVVGRWRSGCGSDSYRLNCRMDHLRHANDSKLASATLER